MIPGTSTMRSQHPRADRRAGRYRLRSPQPTSRADPEFAVSTSAASSVPTRLLCLEDASLRRFEATVISSDPETGAVVLDRTAFYPGGGGQPADTGRLLGGGGRAWTVTAMSKAGGTVVHTVE